MCEETDTIMRWHVANCPNDGNLRHPADTKDWKDFDDLYPEFSQDPYNVRLGFASDGFNLFQTLSISHNTWPVLLVNYNLTSLIFMKLELFYVLNPLVKTLTFTCNL